MSANSAHGDPNHGTTSVPLQHLAHSFLQPALQTSSTSVSGATVTTGLSAGSVVSTPSTTITTPSSTQSVSSPVPPASAPIHQPSTFTISPPLTSSHHPNAGAFRRSHLSIFKYWLFPVIAFIVYMVTLGVASSASARYTLLGRFSASDGTWCLAILVKGGDLAFAVAVADTFDCIAWGKLKKRWRNSGPERFNGVRLGWFFALVSSTGIVGLTLLIWKNILALKKEKGTWIAREWGILRRTRERWRRWRTVRWSLTRLIFLAILIPGPGIILLGKSLKELPPSQDTNRFTADIHQTEVFFDTRSMAVSGGLALFNPDLATIANFVMGPDVSRLAQMMLRDRSISLPVDPVDSLCKASKTCKSYLIAGPYRTVQPWPFTVEDDGSDGFRLHQAPFYQVDMWNVELESELVFNKTTECELYGGFNAKDEYSMKICMKQHTEDTIVAGWQSCQKGYDNTTNKCLEPASLPGGKYGWSTYLHFYRRNATIVFSRETFNITYAGDLSPPQPQDISPKMLFTAVNAMLYRPNQTANNFQYDRNSQPYVLTQVIGSDLWYSLHERMNALTMGKDWLRNILTLPVYLFQPTVIATSENLPLYSQEDGSTPLLNLPDENYVRGSYCIVDERSIPGTKTVIGYACVAGFLLLFVAIAKGVAFRWPDAGTTEYPLVDYEALTQVVDDYGQVVFRERFGPARRDYNSVGVVDELAGLKIGLRTV